MVILTAKKITSRMEKNDFLKNGLSDKNENGLYDHKKNHKKENGHHDRQKNYQSHEKKKKRKWSP